MKLFIVFSILFLPIFLTAQYDITHFFRPNEWYSSKEENKDSVKVLTLGGRNILKGLEPLNEFQNLEGIRIVATSEKNLQIVFNILSKLKKLKYLSVNCGLQQLPTNITKLTELKFLSLTDNNLTKLPKDFYKLKKLEYLNLGTITGHFQKGNDFKEIPKEVFKLKKLRFLYIRDNKIQEIPKSIRKLKNLHYLSCGANKIKYISPKIAKLKKTKRV